MVCRDCGGGDVGGDIVDGGEVCSKHVGSGCAAIAQPPLGVEHGWEILWLGPACQLVADAKEAAALTIGDGALGICKMMREEGVVVRLGSGLDRLVGNLDEVAFVTSVLGGGVGWEL